MNIRTLLNTLYITTPDSYVSRDGTNIVVSVSGSEVGRVPIHNIEQVVCFGYAGASSSAMRLCAENGVTMSFMSRSGRFLSGIHGETRGNVLLRREQYRIADDEARSLAISRNMVLGKVFNCRQLLRKAKNNHQELHSDGFIDGTISELTGFIEAVEGADSSGTLRGIEGAAAHAYFGFFDRLILQNKEEFRFRSRNRRPPRDKVNAMLSFLYALLANDVGSALESAGLDPYVGFFHTDRPGRPSLALDLMEELRPIADRVALTAINLRKVQPGGFVEREGGSVVMDDDTRRIIIDAWQTKKNASMFHPFIKEDIKIGLAPYVQSMLLAKCIRGEIDGYPPLMMKQAMM